MYGNFLPFYFNLFKSKNIRIEIFEEFVGNIEAVKKLYKWMGIDPDFKPKNYKLPVNVSKEHEKNLPTKNFTELSNKFQESNRLVERYLGREVRSWKLENRL